MTPRQILDKARSVEAAQSNLEKFCIKQQGLSADNSIASAQQLTYEATELSSSPTMQRLEADNSNICAALKLPETKYFYCGNKRHPCKDCPANDSVCFKCKKQGHFAKACRSRDARRGETTATLQQSHAVGSVFNLDQNVNGKINIAFQLNGEPVNALFDTISHVSEAVAKRLNLQITDDSTCIDLALKGCCSKSISNCEATVQLQHRKYDKILFSLLKDLLTDVVLGQDFVLQHEKVSTHFGGEKPSLNLNALKALKTPKPPKLFQYLTEDCHPITAKSRRFFTTDTRSSNLAAPHGAPRLLPHRMRTIKRGCA